MKIGNRELDWRNGPYLLAEIGVAHEGNLQRAEQLIRLAAGAGAHGVKFQAYKADRLASKYSPTYFQQNGDAAKTQHEFFSRYDALNPDDYRYLARVAKDCGVDFLCTAFDPETLTWLAPLVPAFKIASADLTNLPLLQETAKYGKPILLSTGAATEMEIDRALWVTGWPICLLHCVLSYPTVQADANLGAIKRLSRGMGEPAGYSDHTLFDADLLIEAWLLGASVIEKHFTDDKTRPGNDHYHSMDAADLKLLTARIARTKVRLGSFSKTVLPCEAPARDFARQSWHATRDIPARTILTHQDVILKRPGLGLPAWESPVGKSVTRETLADSPIMADCLE